MELAEAGNFRDLKPALSKSTLATVDRLGFTSLTPVQASSIPLFLKKKDVVVEAVTGSGKTLAYLIPVLEMLLSREVPLKKHEIGAIIIVPTRELARQIATVCEIFLKDVGDVAGKSMSFMLLTGGHAADEDISKFKKQGASIVISTPGKLEEMMKSAEFNVRELEVLILDEADRLLDLGFEQSLRNIISRLPKQRRTGLFSATMTEGLSELAKAGLRNPVRVVVKVEDIVTKDVQRTPSSLQIKYLFCDADKKLEQLFRILHNEWAAEKTIVYFSTCLSVDYFTKIMSSIPWFSKRPLLSLHGKMVEKKRLAVFEKFSNSEDGILMCTDVAARGLDIPDIDRVIQFDPPQDPQAFLHRCGRTARQGKHGEAVVFLQPQEDTYIEFLRLRKIPLEEMEYADFEAPPLPSIRLPTSYLPTQSKQLPNQDFVTVKKPTLQQFIHALQLNDREIYQRAIQAFVSNLRSYNEHQLKYIFNATKLNLLAVMCEYYLLIVPKCPEIKNAKLKVQDYSEDASDALFVNFIKPSDVHAIKFKDKTREKLRIEAAEKLRIIREKEALEKRKKYTRKEAWSDKKEFKQKKSDRHEKKQKKRDAIRAKQIEESANNLKRKTMQDSEAKEALDDWKQLKQDEKRSRRL